MLSNLVISTQRLVLVIDELGKEKTAQKFICQLLREQGQDESTIKKLDRGSALSDETTYDAFLNDCNSTVGGEDLKWNVLLPALSDLLCYQRPAVIFQFLHRLPKCARVKRVFLWASRPHVLQPFLVAACEHMAELVLHMETDKELSIVTRKPGGGVTNKRYTYKREQNQLYVEPTQSTKSSPEKCEEIITPKAEQLGTFKIELEEDEVVARNALKLPYEKTSEAPEGNIIYTPDADDDFDDEDPDEDLCI